MTPKTIRIIDVEFDYLSGVTDELLLTPHTLDTGLR